MKVEDFKSEELVKVFICTKCASKFLDEEDFDAHAKAHIEREDLEKNISDLCAKAFTYSIAKIEQFVSKTQAEPLAHLLKNEIFDNIQINMIGLESCSIKFSTKMFALSDILIPQAALKAGDTKKYKKILDSVSLASEYARKSEGNTFPAFPSDITDKSKDYHKFMGLNFSRYYKTDLSAREEYFLNLRVVYLNYSILSQNYSYDEKNVILMHVLNYYLTKNNNFYFCNSDKPRVQIISHTYERKISLLIEKKTPVNKDLFDALFIFNNKTLTAQIAETEKTFYAGNLDIQMEQVAYIQLLEEKDFLAAKLNELNEKIKTLNNKIYETLSEEIATEIAASKSVNENIFNLFEKTFGIKLDSDLEVLKQDYLNKIKITFGDNYNNTFTVGQYFKTNNISSFELLKSKIKMYFERDLTIFSVKNRSEFL